MHSLPSHVQLKSSNTAVKQQGPNRPLHLSVAKGAWSCPRLSSIHLPSHPPTNASPHPCHKYCLLCGRPCLGYWHVDMNKIWYLPLSSAQPSSGHVRTSRRAMTQWAKCFRTGQNRESRGPWGSGWGRASLEENLSWVNRIFLALVSWMWIACKITHLI